MMGTMKKIAALIGLLCVCSLASADSLERLVNQYKEKDGAVCRVLNRDYHFNDISGEDMSMDAQRLVGGMMALMGVEEWTTLNLERCKESTRERFVDKAKIVPLTDKELDVLTKKHFYKVKNINRIIRESILKQRIQHANAIES
jgi:hypothetical protein